MTEKRSKKPEPPVLKPGARVDAALRMLRVHKKLGGRLLQDIYPTRYMPHVGRQVMQEGGDVEPIYDLMGNVVAPGGLANPPPPHPREELEATISPEVAEKLSIAGVMVPNRASELRETDIGLMPYDKEGNIVPWVQRPGLAPWVSDEGETRWAMPYILELAGNTIGSAFEPVKGAGVVLGSGPIRRAATEAVTHTPQALEAASQAARELTPLGFYSHAAEVAGTAKQSGNATDLVNWLVRQPGVKREELVAADLLDEVGKPTQKLIEMGKVTPQQLSETIRTGAPNVEEVVLRHKPIDERISFNSQTNSWDVFDENGNFVDSYLDQRMARLAAYKSSENPAKFGPDTYPELTTPGTENYREIVLKLPEIPHEPKYDYMISGDIFVGQRFATREDALAEMEKIRSKLVDLPEDDPVRKMFESKLNRARIQEIEAKDAPRDPNLRQFGHFGDVTNPLLHMRVTEAPIQGTNGRALRVEEIQSDWSQKGRGDGFVTPRQAEIAKQALKEFEDYSVELAAKYNLNPQQNLAMYGSYKNMDPAEVARYEELQRAATQAGAFKKNQLPAAPYIQDTKQWTDLAVKRAFKEAIDIDATELQITKGDIHRKRYQGYEEGDPGYHYDVNVPSSLKRVLKQIDPEAKITTRREAAKIGPEHQEAVDAAEQNIQAYQAERRSIQDQMREAPDDYTYGELKYQLEDLDAMIADTQSRLDALISPNEFWVVEITPKIREAVSKGLTRFADGGAVNTLPDDIFSDWQNYRA